MKLGVSVVVVLVLTFVTSGQDLKKRIGSIDFYGYSGLNVDNIRAALPLHEGDLYPGAEETIRGINKAVRLATVGAPTDIAPVCCDKQGNYMIYVGLPGNSIKHMQYNPVPKGKIRLPAEILMLYEQTMGAATAAVLKGNAREDTSKGYSLSITDESLRAKQLAGRAYAIRNERLLHRVLDSSSEARQRIAAAHMLGYTRQSSHQIAGLVRASHDPDEAVRNNATRALGVLAESNPKIAPRIPASGFIEMLNSGSWSDRNKAAWVLDILTKNRDSKLLNDLRSQALVSLIEMARWQRPSHAYTARILLGRIAGIEDERLRQLANEDNAEQIIDALTKKF